MSNAPNGQRERVGFPMAPINGPYTPVTQMNQFAAPPPSTFPSVCNINGYPSQSGDMSKLPAPPFVNGNPFNVPSGLPPPPASVNSSAFKPYGTDHKTVAPSPFAAPIKVGAPLDQFGRGSPFSSMSSTQSNAVPSHGPPLSYPSTVQPPNPPIVQHSPFPAGPSFPSAPQNASQYYHPPPPSTQPLPPPIGFTGGPSPVVPQPMPQPSYNTAQYGGAPSQYTQPVGTMPPGMNAPRSLSDFLDLSSERNPMVNGLDEIRYELPGSVGGADIRCDPAIMRCTLNSIPQTEELLGKSRLPLGLTLHPFRDVKQLNVIRATTIVRCRYCRTYINPFVTMPDKRRWKCNLCYKANDLPDDFSYDSSTRSFTEPERRPEMQNATVEFIAPTEYMLRNPQPAVYVFILDVSAAAIESGYLETLCEQIVISLDQMPGDERTLIAFLAVDSALHFFQFHTLGKLPRELVIDDIDEVFLPANTGLLVKLKTYKESIRQLLCNLPSLFSSPSATSSSNCLGSALNVVKEMISELGGRISVFQSSLPTVGPGALKSREDPNQRAAGDVDVTPATDFYKRLGLDFTAVQICVDLFALSAQYMDLATLSEMSKYSSGTIYRFPAFHAVDNTGERRRFEKVVTRYLTRKIGFEAVLRIRCSRGLAISSFYGNFFVRSTDLLTLANVSPDSAVGCQLNIEERLGVSTVCFQAALLYTSSKGDRRIRVHTLCLPTTSELTTLYSSVDVRSTVSLLAKMGVERASQGSALTDCREALVNASVDALGAFSKTAGRTGLLAPRGGQLKFLPLFSLALLKNTAFAAGRSIKLDARVASMCTLRSCSMECIMTDMYPLLYRLNDIPELGEGEDPRCLPLSWEWMTRDGVFLMVAGHYVYIYVSASSDPSFVQHSFGCNYHQLEQNSFREQPTAISQKVHSFVGTLLHRLQVFNVPLVIREDSPIRDVFVSRFVDDRSESSHSYVEFVNHIKKEIGH